MDELHGFCVRLLGHGEAARAAEQAGRDAADGADGDRVRGLAAAAASCRAHYQRYGPRAELTDAAPAESASLADAVAGELAQATGRLPERQREALALRELLRLSHAEIGAVVGLGPAAVAPLLARARLRLRTELRGESPPAAPCDERERALRAITLRQDGEPVPDADDDWLLEHLGHCVGCGRAHGAMLEASACYRAWRSDEQPAPAAPGAVAQP